MIDISEKEHVPMVLKIIEECESKGLEVICYKETYTEAKCLIGGWDIPISHYAEKDYFDVIVKPRIELAEKLLAMGTEFCKCRSIDHPKFKRIKQIAEKAR